MKRLLSISIILVGFALFAQQSEAQRELLERAEEIHRDRITDPEKLFKENSEIINEAKRINAKEAELRALLNQCQYYKEKPDYKNLYEVANTLYNKANLYHLPVYQTIAKIYLSDVYLYNHIPEKALQQLNDGYEIINTVAETDSLAILAKSNLFIAFSDYCGLNGECDKVIDYIKKSITENSKIRNESARKKLDYLNYTNLASGYMNINLDSAKYYAELSLAMDDTFKRDDIEFFNLHRLGEIEMIHQNYKNSLSYFKEAETYDGYIHHINQENLYTNMIEAYSILNDTLNLKLYKAKRDSLLLNISKKQNEYLHHLLTNQTKTDEYNTFTYILAALLFILIIFIIFIIRKNRNLIHQERISQKYLEKVSKAPNGDDYSKLLSLLKTNDPAFMFHFNETFLDFSSELLRINPKISINEIEFCALMKLKVPTKDIARYKFLAPKTVLNKKYIIKNKLNIPKNQDIYEWFDNI
ncbi:MAG: hypothetical protein WDA08_00635 [Weeksellaceae bacterium]